MSANKSTKQETLDQFYRRHRRPSLTLPSLNGSTSSGGHDDDNNDDNCDAVGGLPKANVTFQLLRNEINVDILEDPEITPEELQSDVEHIRKRILTMQKSFRDGVVPNGNPLFDLSQDTREERKEKLRKAKLSKGVETAPRKWKVAAEALNGIYKRQQDDRLNSQLNRLDDLAMSTKEIHAKSSSRDAVTVDDFRIPRTAAINVFGEEFKEEDYENLRNRRSLHRHGHHHHRRHRGENGTSVNGDSESSYSDSDQFHSDNDGFSTSSCDTEIREDLLKPQSAKVVHQQSSVNTLEEVRTEQAKIIEAIQEWSELKHRNYGGRYYDIKSKSKPVPEPIDIEPEKPRASGREDDSDFDFTVGGESSRHSSSKQWQWRPASARSDALSSLKFDSKRYSSTERFDGIDLITVLSDLDFGLRGTASAKVTTARLQALAGDDESAFTEDSSVDFCQLDSLFEGSATLDNIVIEGVHEDDMNYRHRGLDEKNYFGEAAKLRFFGKYQQVKANQGKKIVTGGLHMSRSGHGNGLDPHKLRLLSPRTRFLTEYVAQFDNPPTPFIIRLTNSESLDLGDMKLGDDIIILLSRILNDLPRVNVVNLKNNALTDKGIKPLIETLSRQTHITELDISLNKIDSAAALAISGMVRAKTCPLRVLKLSTADLTDSEVSMFTTAFEANKSVTYLDLSRNLLGATESRHEYGKDFSFETLLQTERATVSAGKSLAEALLINKSINHLDLSWNKFGALAAAHLNSALAVTHSLTYLNLAYNNIRDIGAEAMASALFDNSSLRILDVSYNGITAEGCVYFAAALKVNSVLEKFNLSGNPIGDPGGIAILHCINYHSVNREISLHSCTYPKIYDFDASIPRLTFPTRKFVLNMKLLRDRVIAMELFRLASTRRGYVFKKIEHVSGEKKDKAKKVVISLRRAGNPAELMGHAYYPWSSAAHRNHHPYCHMTADDWVSVVNRLELIDEATGWPWRIPSSGTLIIDFVYYPRCATPIDCLNASGLQRLIKMLVDHRKTVVDLLRLCTQSIALESEQLADILLHLPSSELCEQNGNTVAFSQQELLEVFIRLLPCVRDGCNVDALIQQHFPNNYRKRQIQMHLRSIYYVTLGSYSGHYKLDLADALDRQCAIRLAEIDADENLYINHTMPAWAANKGHSYTSQYRTARTNFRNAYFRGASVVMNDEFFCLGLENLQRGLLEFDFISTTRPATQVKIVGDYDLNGLLVSRGLRGRIFGIQAAMDPSLLPKFDDESREEKPKEEAATPVKTPPPSQARTLIRRAGVMFAATDSPGGGSDSDSASTDAARKNSLGSMIQGKSVGITGISSTNSPLSVLMAAKLLRKKGAPSGKSTKAAAQTDPAETTKEEDHRLSIGGSLQVTRAAASFLRKFKMMKQRLGSWLFHDKYRNANALLESLHVHNSFLTKEFTKEGANIVFNEVVKQDALYYAGDALHRFVVRVAVRIHSNDVKSISKVKAMQQKREELNLHSLTAAKQGKKGVKRILQVNGAGAATGVDVKSSSNDESHQRHHSIDVGYYGSLLEACCVWRVVTNPETGQTELKHSGSQPYSHFVGSQPLDDIPYIKLKPCSLQHGMRSDPTHKKFRMYDDVSVSGTEIMIRVKCTHWASMKKIEEYTKTFLNKLFPSYRVRPSDIKTTSTMSSETDEDIFVDPKLPKGIQTQVVLHHMDFTVEQIPFARKALLKIQLSTTDVGTLGSMGSMIFGRSSSSKSGKTEGGLKRQNSSKEAPTSTDPDVGKMFVVWRWRDVDDSDRDPSAPDQVKVMEHGKRLGELRSTSCRIWINCKQAASIINEFPVSCGDGHNYRLEAAVTIFSRVVDIENFNLVADALPVNYHAELYNRIGWFNALNFFTLSRYLDLDLRIEDNRRLALVIVTLFVGGGGISMLEQKFRRSFDYEFVPGWEIPACWDAATYTGNLTPGIPMEGNFVALVAMKDDTNTEKMERYHKLRQELHDKYSLLAVPRNNGSDFHLEVDHQHFTGETLDWDGLKR